MCYVNVENMWLFCMKGIDYNIVYVKERGLINFFFAKNKKYIKK